MVYTHELVIIVVYIGYAGNVPIQVVVGSAVNVTVLYPVGVMLGVTGTGSPGMTPQFHLGEKLHKSACNQLMFGSEIPTPRYNKYYSVPR